MKKPEDFSNIGSRINVSMIFNPIFIEKYTDIFPLQTAVVEKGENTALL